MCTLSDVPEEVEGAAMSLGSRCFERSARVRGISTQAQCAQAWTCVNVSAGQLRAFESLPWQLAVVSLATVACSLGSYWWVSYDRRSSWKNKERNSSSAWAQNVRQETTESFQVRLQLRVPRRAS